MAHHFSSSPSGSGAQRASSRAPPTQQQHYHNHHEDDYEDDEDEDSFDHSKDKIRRNYLHHAHGVNMSFDANRMGGPEPIQVKLNESYFANEKRAIVNLLANARTKLNSMQMFNPAKNQTIKEQQETWSDKVSLLIIILCPLVVVMIRGWPVEVSVGSDAFVRLYYHYYYLSFMIDCGLLGQS